MTSDSSGMPRAAKAASAPASLSITVTTRSTTSPNSWARSMAKSDEPPVVVTSSTITTRAPGWTGPSMNFFVPWSFDSLRTMNPSRGMPCTPAIVTTALVIGSAPIDIPPTASGRWPRAVSFSRIA